MKPSFLLAFFCIFTLLGAGVWAADAQANATTDTQARARLLKPLPFEAVKMTTEQRTRLTAATGAWEAKRETALTAKDAFAAKVAAIATASATEKMRLRKEAVKDYVAYVKAHLALAKNGLVTLEDRGIVVPDKLKQCFDQLDTTAPAATETDLTKVTNYSHQFNQNWRACMFAAKVELAEKALVRFEAIESKGKDLLLRVKSSPAYTQNERVKAAVDRLDAAYVKLDAKLAELDAIPDPKPANYPAQVRATLNVGWNVLKKTHQLLRHLADWEKNQSNPTVAVQSETQLTADSASVSTAADVQTQLDNADVQATQETTASGVTADVAAQAAAVVSTETTTETSDTTNTTGGSS